MKKAMLNSNSSRIFTRRVKKKKKLASGDCVVGASVSSQKNSERSE